MASHQDEIPSIHMFFEKHAKDVLLTRLYQDILRYGREVNNLDFPESKNNHSFTAWELTDWLVDNHRGYIEDYKDFSTRNTPKRVRIASRVESIDGILNKFAELGLIQSLGKAKARRGDTITTYYYFTILGYMLAWIIESCEHIDAKKRDIADQKIYNIMNYYFNKDPSSFDIFYSTLFKKFKEKGVFGEFVVDTLKDRINSNAPIWTMGDLFESLGSYEESNSLPKLYYDLWKETMNQMPDTVKILRLHDLKLDIERRMFDIVADVRYERLRYDLREKYDVLAMEAKCEKCLYVRYIEINILKYFGIIESSGLDEVPDICPQCQSLNSIVISKYI
ncbi:MAG: hypothetical protein WA323_16435 [Candidatus Nitrosopolaris sp.]